ncbi:hypothetical protein BH11PLA2_BH11PLA2_10960 [soil metagenome]
MIRIACLSAAFLLAVSFGAVTRAEDPALDWSKFTKHGEISGVIVKGSTDHLVLEVPKMVQNKTNGNRSRGGKNRRPSMKLGHEDIDIHFAPQGLVRWEKMPTNVDDKGVKIFPTSKELDKMRLPIGAPGFAAERTDLKPGHMVTITLVRPSDIQASKVTDADIVIKYAVIKGETTPPKNAGKDAPKKK